MGFIQEKPGLAKKEENGETGGGTQGKDTESVRGEAGGEEQDV
jgi:hypothetical protein